MPFASAVRSFDLAVSRGASRRVPADSVPARICVSIDIRNFASFWPRSSGLGEAHCFPFQCADLIELLCDTVVPARQAEPWLIAVLNQNDEPLALLPLCIEHPHDTHHPISDIRLLKFLDGGLSDYNAPVLFPAAANWDVRTVRKIWRGMRKVLPAFDIAIFEKMADRVDDLRNPLLSLKGHPQGKSGHAANLSGTWETFEARIPGHKELRRKARRLSQMGRFRCEIAETPEQYDMFLDALFRQKRQRDLKVRGYDSLLGAGYPAYLRQARRHIYPSGPVCLFALRIDDTIIATHFGVVAGCRFIAQIPGFEDGEWRRYSLGTLLNYKIVEWCFKQGIRVFDLGAGDEEYKGEYCDVTMALHKAIIPSTFRGAISVHAPKILDRMHKRRVESWRELELAEKFCADASGASHSMAHACRSLILWPSPKRTREVLRLTKRIRTRKSRKAA